MAEAETQVCNNCKKQISANNFTMHEVHCKRHIALCKHCNEPIPKGEMEVHFEESHAKIACPKCAEEVEKMHLEDHEENSCKKKPMDCVYCQLKYPKNEFEAHIDHCGSRTEQCPKCGQYIKLKDQTKHEDTKCRYPEVKPTNINRPDPGGPLNGHNNDYLSGLPGMSPFAFEEMTRVLGRPEIGRQQHLVEQARQPTVQEARGVEPDRRRQTRQNVSVKRAPKTSVKLDVNKHRGQQASQRAQASHPGGGQGENEYDHLLAMHLAQDLNHDDEDIDALMRQFEKPKSPLSPTFNVEEVGRNRNTFSEDMVMIPCEFCGEPYTADDLVQHQSGCSLDRISDVLPTLISANNRTDGINNAGGGRGDRSPVVDPPAIINNLRNFDADQWLDDTTGYPVENGDDEMLLPCEFCDELFPMDSLVQHQAICDNNTTVTPRVMTPAEPQVRRPIPKKKTPAVHALEADFPNLSSRRHQPPPGILGNDSDDDSEPGVRPKKYTIGATHRVRKPNTTAASNRTADETAIDNIEQVLNSYGAELQDRGDNSTRQRGSVRQNASNNSDSWLQPSTQVHKFKPTMGASRPSRNSIDSLLNDSDQGSSSHDLLGHVGASQRNPKRSDIKPVTRKVAGSQATGVAGRVPASTKSRITSRDVPHDPSRQISTNSTGQTKNRSSRPNFEVRVRPAEADETSSMVTAQRRTRANHVFGASNATRTSKR